MDTLLRLFLRFLVVPLGMVAAVVAATLVATFANWAKFVDLIAADAGGPAGLEGPAMLLGAVLVAIQSLAVVVMLFPGLVGILLSEAFAIRTWMFHAPVGGLSIWIGWTAMEDFRRNYDFYGDPKIVVAAGIAGGFAYWAVAGWNAGFWKPVFRSGAEAVHPGDASPPAGRNLL